MWTPRRSDFRFAIRDWYFRVVLPDAGNGKIPYKSLRMQRGRRNSSDGISSAFFLFYGVTVFSSAFVLIGTDNNELADTAVSCFIVHLFRMELYTIDTFGAV